ncbi:MAG: ferritin family protein [Sedimentisphaerales bacterium]|nr:ferritin family protein [Sedimentisphaerales bacterium]
MDLFDHAIQMEKDSYSFYLEAAESLQDTAAQRIMREVAQDERDHEKALQDMKNGIQADLEISIARGVKSIFEQMIEIESNFLDEDGSITDVLRRGAEIERMSVELYHGFAEKDQPSHEREFWKKLQKIEEKHEKLLRLTLEYIDKPNIVLENAEFLFYDYNKAP